MTGVKFSYVGGKEVFFGCVDDEVGACFQAIDHHKGERVIGVAVLEFAEGYPLEIVDDDDGERSILSASSRPLEAHSAMERILVSTKWLMLP
jgi:hypothetical protein